MHLICMRKPVKTRPEDIKAIGQRLRALRQTTGMQQGEFALHCGFTQAQWSNIENGISRISVDAAMVLQRKFRIPLDWVYLGETAWLPSGIRDALERVDPDAVKERGGANGSTAAQRFPYREAARA